MNTNSNTYTIIYSTVLVILVAAILAFVAISLQPKQNENVKIETVSKVISAATNTFDVSGEGNILKVYADNIVYAYYIDGYGRKVDSMNTGEDNLDEIQVPTTSDLKKQNDLIKKIEAGNEGLLGELRLPVFGFVFDGTFVSVVPCYGPGLWGPIWGYVAVERDGATIHGAVFDHKSETPGLGAKIAEEPFSGKFPGKRISSGEVKFSVIKNGDPDDPFSVDAITGASITSRSLGACLNTWFKYYEPYLNELPNLSGNVEETLNVEEE